MGQRYTEGGARRTGSIAAMNPILVIENDPHDPLGNLGDAIEARGLKTEIVRPPSGDRIPAPMGYAGVVVLGGPQGAYEADIHPFLDDEIELNSEAVAGHVPLLGICLGSQLVAHALGGKAYLADRPEVAVIEPQLTEEGRDDPIADLITKPVLTFHQDTFDVPPRATVIARSDRYTQAFRCGSALAIQPHPEVIADDLEHWVSSSPIPERAGVDGDVLIDTFRSSVDVADAAALFDSWLDELPAPTS
jgi:GMP synthase (glutamine-hydrolysing)